MKEIFYNVIEKKIAKLIRFYGNGINEIVIDIYLSFGLCNSIELDDEENILLHIFDDNNFDIIFDFDDLDEQDKLIILQTLNTI